MDSTSMTQIVLSMFVMLKPLTFINNIVDTECDLDSLDKPMHS